MAICTHGRSINNCPLCPVKTEPQPVQTNPAVAVTPAMSAAQQNPGAPVQKTDGITDPTARLAQEYAQELENMAAIRAALENGRNLVRTLEADEAASHKKCSAVFKQLQASMVPATPKVTRKKRVEIREKEAAAKEEIILADSAAY